MTKTPLLAEMQSRIGISEIRGKKHNPVIIQWFKNVGHPEVKDDETSFCSVGLADAALTVGLPIPPRDVVMMAKSWSSWGANVEKTAVAIRAALEAGFDVVAIWPRGDPKGWQGHVNVVEAVKGNKVVCVGANQRVPGQSYDGVTRSAPRPIKEAIAFRRYVPATIPALKDAGSTEAAKIDLAEKVTVGGGVVLAAAKAADETGAFEPSIKDVAENVDALTSLLEGAKALAKFAMANVAISTFVLLVVAFFVVRWWRRNRLQRHESGQPISTQV